MQPAASSEEKGEDVLAMLLHKQQELQRMQQIHLKLKLDLLLKAFYLKILKKIFMFA